MTEKHYPDGTLVTFAYDERGNLIQYSDATGRTTQQFDINDRLTMITYPGARWLAYTYNNAGRRASMYDQLGHGSHYHYDAVGRLQSLTDENTEEIVRYDYDDAGRMILKTLGNGVYTTYGYDVAGQMTELSNLKPDGSILSQFNYTYDSRGRRTTMTTTYGAGDPRNNHAGIWTYDYDDSGQLIGWTAPDGRRVDYTYDALGNRLNVLDNDINTAYLVNERNQYSQVGDVTYQYDADGNLIEEIAPGGTTAYTWSADNKLIGVSGLSSGWQAFYDALGNRTRVAEGDLVKDYVIDPYGLGNVVAEYLQGNPSPLARYQHGGGLLSRQAESGNEHYTFDALGSTSELVGDASSVSNAYSYSPFSELLFKLESVGNTFQFVGEQGVMASIDGLSYMRTRNYKSQLGRFTSPDPLGTFAFDTNLNRGGFNSKVQGIYSP